MSNHSREQFLETYDREHETTMRVLRAYPTDQLDLRPHEKLKNARELAWVFALESGLGRKIWNDEFAKGMPSGNQPPPSAPEDWEQLLGGIEAAYHDFRGLVAGASDDDFHQEVHFFTAPKTLGGMSRKDMSWMLLHDQIHHRGQFSVYLRMAGGKVPSIYGPTADEQWI